MADKRSSGHEVSFDGRRLRDSLPAVVARVVIGGMQPKVESMQRAVGDGAFFASVAGEPRKVTLTLSLMAGNERERSEYAQAFRDWAHSDKPKRFETSARRDQYLMAICTKMPDFSGANAAEELTAEFTAFDPYFVNNMRRVLTLGSTAVSFEIGGNAEPLCYIRAVLASAVADPEWVLDSTRTIRLNGSVSAGVLTIDLNSQTIDLDGTSQMSKLAFTSDFFGITAGKHTLSGTGKLYWRERWV